MMQGRQGQDYIPDETAEQQLAEKIIAAYMDDVEEASFAELREVLQQFAIDPRLVMTIAKGLLARSSIPTPAKMNEHVRSLCAQNEIIVSECQHASQALALRECSQAIIPPVRSANSYAVALHEIGHVLGRYQQSKSTMVREKWAWQWARENARVWTSGMEQFAKGSLAWYLHRHSTRGEIRSRLV